MTDEAIWTPDRPATTPPNARRPQRRGVRFDKRFVVLVVLLPVLIVVWIPVLSGGGSPAPAPTPAAATPAPLPAAPAGETAAELPAPVVRDTATLLADVETRIAPFAPRWSPAAGDPFAAEGTEPAPVAPSPTAATDARAPTALVPSTVLISAGEPPIAIIGGRACRTGDEVAGHRIVAIEERRVVYRRDGETFAVVIPPPSLGKKRP